MSAPERIWAWETLNYNGQWTIAEGEGDEYVRRDTTYTEADMERAVKAALEAAAECAEKRRRMMKQANTAACIAMLDAMPDAIRAIDPAEIIKNVKGE